MVALIREPPRNEGPARRISLRSSHDEVDVSAIARASGGGGHRQAAGFSSERSIDEIIDFIRREFALATQGDGAAAESLRPVGVALVDKPAGPSSFAIVAALRRQTRARTGHAGTLDPFATGLLVLLSGAATRLAPCFVGLDKRYVTDVDLTSTTSTGDPEGRAARAPSGTRAGRARASARGPSRRGRAADPRRVGGQDRRRARLQAGAPGRRRRDAGAALARALARGRRVHRRDGAPRAPRQLGHLRPVDRAGARRPLHDSAPDRGRAVRGR